MKLDVFGERRRSSTMSKWTSILIRVILMLAVIITFLQVLSYCLQAPKLKSIPRPAIPKPTIPPPEVAKPEVEIPEVPKPEVAKPEVAKPEVPKPETAKPESPPELAKAISAADLLARTPTRTPGVIPKIFHQSWKSLELPNKFKQWSETCRRQHRDWEWVLWTDEDNLNLVKKYYPWLEKVYNGMPGVIYRADMARHLYMYTYGGVYSDLDTECIRSTEDLEKKYGPLFTPSDTPRPDRAMFGRMGPGTDFVHAIPNAWAASTPGHPMFLQAIRHVIDIYNSSGPGIGNPEDTTGPIALRESVFEYEEQKVRWGPALDDAVKSLTSMSPFADSQPEDHQVTLLPSSLVYPYSWSFGGEDAREECWLLTNNFDPEKCKAKLDVDKLGSICVTYWSHSHTPTGHLDFAIDHLN